MIKVLLVEDHTLVRKGIRSLLETTEGMEVVGEAEDGREALALVVKTKPDIVLMDISMPSLNGLEATRMIRKQNAQVRVLILTMHDNEEYIYQAFKAGVSGYIIKRAGLGELVSAIRSVVMGDAYLSPSISRTVIQEYIRHAEVTRDETLMDRLTEREREIFQLIVEALSNKEISDRLHISVKTVESHKSHIMVKLNATSTVDLVKQAVRYRLIDLD